MANKKTMNKTSDRTIILKLLIGAVPEKAEKLTKLWGDLGHKIIVEPNAKGSKMEACRQHIAFTTKTIDYFWLHGFVSWRSIEVYCPALRLAIINNCYLDAALSADKEIYHYEQTYKYYHEIIKQLLNADNTSEINWPADIPMPTDKRLSLKKSEQMTTFDLISLALAFVFLHEVKHVQFRVEQEQSGIAKKKKLNNIDEEVVCDAWAREFMMSDIDKYARQHNCSYEEVAEKRAMGLALAAVIIHSLTSPSIRWGNKDYPPIAQRFEILLKNHHLSDNSNFWFFTSCLLIGILRQDRRPLNYKEKTYKDFVMKFLLDIN